MCAVKAALATPLKEGSKNRKGLTRHAQWETHLAHPQGSGYRLAQIADHFGHPYCQVIYRLK